MIQALRSATFARPPVNNPQPSSTERVKTFCRGVFESMYACLASLPLIGRVLPQAQVVVVQKPSMKDSACQVARKALYASTQFVSSHKKTVIAATVIGVAGATAYAFGVDGIRQVIQNRTLPTFSNPSPVSPPFSFWNFIGSPLSRGETFGLLALGLARSQMVKHVRPSTRPSVEKEEAPSRVFANIQRIPDAELKAFLLGDEMDELFLKMSREEGMALVDRMFNLNIIDDQEAERMKGQVEICAGVNGDREKVLKTEVARQVSTGTCYLGWWDSLSLEDRSNIANPVIDKIRQGIQLLPDERDDAIVCFLYQKQSKVELSADEEAAILEAELAARRGAVTLSDDDKKTILEAELAARKGAVALSEDDKNRILQVALAAKQEAVALSDDDKNRILEDKLAEKQGAVALSDDDKNRILEAELAARQRAVALSDDDKNSILEAELAAREGALELSEDDKNRILQAALAAKQRAVALSDDDKNRILEDKLAEKQGAVALSDDDKNRILQVALAAKQGAVALSEDDKNRILEDKLAARKGAVELSEEEKTEILGAALEKRKVAVALSKQEQAEILGAALEKKQEAVVLSEEEKTEIVHTALKAKCDAFDWHNLTVMEQTNIIQTAFAKHLEIEFESTEEASLNVLAFEVKVRKKMQEIAREQQERERAWAEQQFRRPSLI